MTEWRLPSQNSLINCALYRRISKQLPVFHKLRGLSKSHTFWEHKVIHIGEPEPQHDSMMLGDNRVSELSEQKGTARHRVSSVQTSCPLSPRQSSLMNLSIIERSTLERHADSFRTIDSTIESHPSSPRWRSKRTSSPTELSSSEDASLLRRNSSRLSWKRDSQMFLREFQGHSLLDEAESRTVRSTSSKLRTQSFPESSPKSEQRISSRSQDSAFSNDQRTLLMQEDDFIFEDCNIKRERSFYEERAINTPQRKKESAICIATPPSMWCKYPQLRSISTWRPYPLISRATVSQDPTKNSKTECISEDATNPHISTQSYFEKKRAHAQRQHQRARAWSGNAPRIHGLPRLLPIVSPSSSS